ncbi:MAG: DUF2271 domain-containing protein [Negativicutes bacterium]|nr:DUF2271 domain-containing protein [Negativicutes bacterium]
MMVGIRKIKMGVWLVGVLLLVSATVAGAATQPAATISFDFTRIDNVATNQYAVWIEDSKGYYVRTLSATHFAATGGFNRRPDTLPLWVGVSQWGKYFPADLDAISAATKTTAGSSGEVDAVSTATPPTGAVVVNWDLKDSKGQMVPAGTYTYKIEGNIYKAGRVVWTGTIKVGDGPNSSVATAQYLPDKAAATEKGLLITNVKASYK